MPMNSSRSHDLLEEIELIDAPGGDKLRLCFDGPFEGKIVRWSATLYIPAAWASAFNEPEPERNIIDISESDENGLVLRLCLKVECIDRPTVRKTVMMVRQYKRLKRGRHEFG